MGIWEFPLDREPYMGGKPWPKWWSHVSWLIDLYPLGFCDLGLFITYTNRVSHVSDVYVVFCDLRCQLRRVSSWIR